MPRSLQVRSHRRPSRWKVSAAECHRRLLARAQAEGRADDTPAVIDRRLAAYDGDMDPVLRWYEARGLLLRIDGAGDPAQVTGRILAAIRLR